MMTISSIYKRTASEGPSPCTFSSILGVNLLPKVHRLVPSAALAMFLLLIPMNAFAQVSYTPDSSFQNAVKDKLVQLYHEFWSDDSLRCIGVPQTPMEYFQNKWKVEKSYIQKIENYFDTSAKTPSQVLDFANAAEELFSSPNREYRWDEALLAVMNKVLQRSDVEDVYKLRPGYIVGNVSKNKEGTVAEDFEYLGTDGELHKLSDIKAENIFLVFGSEGCNECAKFKKQIKGKSFEDAVKRRELAILYITITWDLEFWKKRVKLPGHVLSGFDIHHYITDRTYDTSNTIGPLYNMSTYPVVYWLDGTTRTVLFKELLNPDLIFNIKR